MTGAGGMTGRALALALIARGDAVTVMQRRASGIDTATATTIDSAYRNGRAIFEDGFSMMISPFVLILLSRR